MDVLTGAKMRMVDEETIRRHCPGLELMERAGRNVAEFIAERYGETRFKASVFVGPGNNGGDALVVARYLSDKGLPCVLHYLKPPQTLSMDAAKNYQRLQERLADYPKLEQFDSARPDWTKIVQKDLIDSTVIVDGLFGTGMSRNLGGRARDVVKRINGAGLPVVSIDTPSGIHTDTGQVLGEAVRATHTVTMGFPKLGMLFYPAKTHVGELIVADLGFPDEVVEVNSLGIYWLDRDNAARRLPYREPDAHKYRMGTVLVIAGSRAYTGAALLTAEAALRSGSGMVYVAVPESIRPVIQSALREAIVVPVAETEEGTIAKGAMAQLESYIERADALAVGPGIATNPETLDFVRDVASQSTKTLVLDADAVTAFAADPDGLAALRAPTVITPHSGELGNVVGQSVPTDPVGRIELTRELAKQFGVTLVHKGAPTLIASAEGEVWVSKHGHSALATGGSGDVLTGLVAGVCAQGAVELDASCVACFLHGRAAERAAEDWGLRGVVAGDLLRYLGDPILELEAFRG
jgi:NAD(P)H-hydrate epimerase